MIWIFYALFCAGFLVGVVFMALLTAAREPERRYLPEESEDSCLEGTSGL